MKKLALVCLPLLALAGCQDPATTGQGSSRSELRIVGSSTVFPFAKKVSEQFHNADPSRPSPILESTGTGGGIELFCGGVGTAFPDIANASRRMKKAEFERCKSNGVTDIVEIEIGYDGIAIAQSVKGPALKLTVTELYDALAAKPFGKASNDHRRWSDVNGALPAVAINIYGPPSTSGTRDAVEELIMEAGCKTDPKVAALKDSDKEQFEAVCHTIRSDGAYVDTGENDNLIVQKLGSNPNSVGIFSFSYLSDNAETVRGIPINGVVPSYDSIADGSYPGARPLFLYVKKQHVGVIPGIREYLEEFMKAAGPDGSLSRDGLITSPEASRTAMMARLSSLDTLSGDELK